eukprot:scaffold121442_cov37-Tisochrysis_lutea.AAC.1
MFRLSSLVYGPKKVTGSSIHDGAERLHRYLAIFTDVAEGLGNATDGACTERAAKCAIRKFHIAQCVPGVVFRGTFGHGYESFEARLLEPRHVAHNHCSNGLERTSEALMRGWRGAGGEELGAAREHGERAKDQAKHMNCARWG